MPRKKKEVNPVAKAQHELAQAIITPLYPALLTKHQPAVDLIDLALATYKPVALWQNDMTSSVTKAGIRMSLIQLREAVEKYSDEATKKTVLKHIAQLEEVSIGAKK